jgi:hypothetical protein
MSFKANKRIKRKEISQNVSEFNIRIITSKLSPHWPPHTPTFLHRPEDEVFFAASQFQIHFTGIEMLNLDIEKILLN